ncbi:MAG: hypothetical protein LDL11_01970 [Desulfarculus sp.]|nr:hypothetical protein [Desulfarculus sp.]
MANNRAGEAPASSDLLVMEEIKLIFKEKEIALQQARVGIMILLFQSLLFCVLIIFSKNYLAIEILHLVVPFYLVNAGLFLLGVYLLLHSLRKIRSYDATVARLRAAYREIGDLIA